MDERGPESVHVTGMNQHCHVTEKVVWLLCHRDGRRKGCVGECRKFRVHPLIEIARANIERLELRANYAHSAITIRNLKLGKTKLLTAAQANVNLQYN
jgi:hypothetical protein